MIVKRDFWHVSIEAIICLLGEDPEMGGAWQLVARDEHNSRATVYIRGTRVLTI